MCLENKARFRPGPEGERGAFTLIEVLVAGAVAALLIVLITTVTSHVLSLWNRTAGTLAVNATARTVFEELTLDVQGLQRRADGQAWLLASVQRTQSGHGDAAAHEVEAYPAKKDKADWGDGGPRDFSKPRSALESLQLPVAAGAPLEEFRFGQAGVWLRFFTTRGMPEKSDGGVVHAVGYQLVRRSQKKNSREALYDLQRAAMPAWASGDGVDYGARGHDLFAPGYGRYRDINGAVRSSIIRAADRKRSLGTEVIDFGVRISELRSNGTFVEVFPVNRRDGGGIPVDTPFSYALCSDPGRLPTDQTLTGPVVMGHPARLRFEFLLRVLTPEGAGLVQAYEEDPDRFPGRSWWDIAREHSKVFVHTVSPLASGL